MQSQLTVRLPDDLDQEVSNYAKSLRLKRSDVVRMALERFFKESLVGEERSPYELVRDLIGSIDSGIPDLGQAHRKHLMERIKRRA